MLGLHKFYFWVVQLIRALAAHPLPNILESNKTPVPKFKKKGGRVPRREWTSLCK